MIFIFYSISINKISRIILCIRDTNKIRILRIHWKFQHKSYEYDDIPYYYLILLLNINQWFVSIGT